VGGGLLVYSKKGVQILPIDKYKDCEFNQFCAFRLPSANLNLILVYRPPSSRSNNTEQLCRILRDMQNDTILIGDMNMPGIDWIEEKADSKGRELLETTMEQNLSQMVSFPTHTKGNVLDLVITNNPERVLDIWDVGWLGRSDHCILEVIVEGNPIRGQQQEEKYDWNRADMKRMRMEMDKLIGGEN
jgi:hypothetical protein